MTKKLCYILLLIGVFHAKLKAQCPSADFTIDSEFCLGQNLYVNNSSIGDSFTWELCPDKISGNSTTSTWNSGNTIFRASYSVFNQEYNDIWQGFTIRNTGAAYRFEYDIDNTTITSVTSIGGSSVSLPRDFQIVEDGGNWFGLITNSGSINPTLVEFGSDLLNTTPSYSNITLSSNLYNTNGLKLFKDSDKTHALIGNDATGTLNMLQFNNGLKMEPSVNSFSIADASDMTGIDLVKNCDYWYGLVTSRGNNKLFKLVFDNGLTNTPTIEEITIPDTDYISPAKVKIISENDFYYAFIQMDAGKIFKLEFGNTLANTPSISTLESPSSSCHGIDVSKMSSDYWQITSVDYVNATKGLFGYTIGEECSITNHTSNEYSPSNLTIDTPGDYKLRLTVNNSSGAQALEKSFTVTSSTAPNISFNIDDSRCVSNTNSFTSTDDGNIATYSWDFNGDGIEDDTGASADYSFSTDGAGTYSVTLSVESVDGCTNTATQDITVYRAPTTPEFDYSATALCSNTDITFTNLTIENGSTDAITYVWDFNGEGSSSDKDPVFAFTSTGTKTVSMYAYIPGCTTAIHSEDIEIIEGPTVDFSYTNNCSSASLIQFTDASSGTGLDTYAWDFGDGTGTSTVESPSYSFGATGDFNVALTVSNTSGCETTATQTISVSDDPKVSFSYGEAVENVAVSFIGNDLTIADDAINSWAWDFDGLGASSAQNPSFTFSTPGDYNVSLTVNTNQGCEETISQTISIEAASCPTAAFEVNPEFCSGEIVTVNNTSINASNYFWSVCDDQLAATIDAPDQLLSTQVSQVYAFDFIDQNRILAIRNSGVPYLITVNDSINNVESISSFADPGAFSSLPRDLKTAWNNENLYAIYTNSGGTSITRAVWNNGDLTQEPTYDFIPDFTVSGGSNGLELIEDNGNFYAFVGANNSNQLSVLSFGNDLAATPTVNTFNIADLGSVRGISLTKECGTWVGLVTSQTDNQIVKIVWDAGLSSAPSITEISVSDANWNSPAKVKIAVDQGYFYAFVQIQNSSIFKFEFENSLINNSPTISKSNGLSTGAYALDIVKSNAGQWKILSIDYFDNDGLYAAPFNYTCNIENFSSTLTSPTFSFQDPGTYNIKLVTYNDENAFNATTQSINVSSSTAPNISFNIDDSRCVSNTNSFTSTDDGNITTYSWDFNGDGLEDDNIANPTYDFSADGAGAYEVRLSVSDGTCNNLAVQEISLYNAPPSPSFEVSSGSPYCSYSELSFSNTTDESNHTGADISYSWDFGDASTEVAGTSVSHRYQAADSYPVELTMSIPGCSTTAIQDVVVIAGPDPDFVMENDCYGESTAFINLSAGDNLINPFWDFGDDLGSSSLSDPSYAYQSAGDFPVTLTMENEAGCVNEITRTIRINGLPEVAFLNTPGCEGSTISFTDASTSGDAINNLQSWTWDFGSQGESSEQNPDFTFTESGNYEVSLTITNTGNCSNSISQTVIVRSSPHADFDIMTACLGESSSFTDISEATDGNEIATWYWEIDGQEYFTQDVSEVFESAGTYSASLTVTPTNLCTTTVTKEFTIYNLPAPDFSVSDNCDNAATIFTDQSTSEGPAIVSRLWSFDEQGTANGQVTSHLFNQADDYEVSLRIIDELGCQNAITQTVIVHTSPVASFNVDDEYGGAPLTASFRNTSNDALNYQWNFGDGSEFSIEENPTHTFMENGDYLTELVVFNEFCSDSAYIEMLVATPELDLQLSRLEARQENGALRLYVTARNNSSFNLNGFDVQINFENQSAIIEAYDERLRRGESITFPLNFTLPIDGNIQFLCVELLDKEAGVEDQDPINNQSCINFEQDLVIEKPYPNPLGAGNNTLHVQAILPSKSPVQLHIIDATGNVIFSQTFLEVNSGLNTFNIDTESFGSGVYFVRVIYNGQENVQKVLKR